MLERLDPIILFIKIIISQVIFQLQKKIITSGLSQTISLLFPKKDSILINYIIFYIYNSKNRRIKDTISWSFSHVLTWLLVWKFDNLKRLWKVHQELFNFWQFYSQHHQLTCVFVMLHLDTMYSLAVCKTGIQENPNSKMQPPINLLFRCCSINSLFFLFHTNSVC